MILEVKNRPRKLLYCAFLLTFAKYSWLTFLVNPSIQISLPSNWGTETTKRKNAPSSIAGACPFWTYNKTEYYPLDDALPPLLKDAKYIRGQYPVYLDIRNSPQKLCIDPRTYQGVYLSSDGMNPSIVAVDRLNDESSKPFLQRGIRYLATLCIKKAGLRCPTHSRSQNATKSPLERSTFLIGLNVQFQTVAQAIITTKLDVDAYGSQAILRRKHVDEVVIDYLDDARIFVFQNQLMVEFHSFQRFGKKMHQVSPLYVSFTTGSDYTNSFNMTASIVASQTEFFCCGKNMAMLVHDTELAALEWIDPVSVIHLSKKGGKFYPKHTIADKIHGTNGFMVNLGNNELLGVGHFHRDDPAVESGTHYTHAFFTLSATAPFELLRLSNEWYIASPQKSSQQQTQQPEIIQFASGIDFVADSNRSQLVISYGINDCEGAVCQVEMETVQKMLIPTKGKGQQVGDFMFFANAT
jgi:hypothetical protein